MQSLWTTAINEIIFMLTVGTARSLEGSYRNKFYFYLQVLLQMMQT